MDRVNRVTIGVVVGLRSLRSGMRVLCGREAVGMRSCVQTRSQLVELGQGIWEFGTTNLS